MNLLILKKKIDYVSFLGQDDGRIKENLKSLFGPQAFSAKGNSIELNVAGALIHDLCREILELRDNKSLDSCKLDSYDYLMEFVERKMPVVVSDKIDDGTYKMINPFVSDMARERVSKMLVLSFAKELMSYGRRSS